MRKLICCLWMILFFPNVLNAAWQAEVIKAAQVGPNVVIEVRFTDGPRTWENQYNFRRSVFALNDLKRLVLQDLAELVAADTAKVELDKLVGQTLDATIKPTVPTQAEIDRAAFAADLDLLSKMQSAIAKNVISATQPQYLTLLKSIQDRLIANPSYINLF